MSARETPQEHYRPLTPDALAGTSVWAVAQRPLPAQRRGRYLPASGHHPARMAPDLAAHIIHTYTVPADLVVDPMCGIGTTLVEAVHAGRHGMGIDCEKRWTTLAGQNLDLARAQGATGTAEVVHADSRDLPGVLPWHLVALAGTATLVLTSPPYGPATHAHARVASTQRTGQAGVTHRRDSYADPADAANLANAPTTQALIDGFTQILHAAAWLLHPTGRLVITARPWRENGELIDLPSMIIDAAEHAGFIHTDRCVALLTGLRHGRLQPRPSFLQLLQLRRARTAGTRLHLIAHEDVLIFEVAPQSMSSRIPGDPQGSGSLTPLTNTNVRERDAGLFRAGQSLVAESTTMRDRSPKQGLTRVMAVTSDGRFFNPATSSRARCGRVAGSICVIQPGGAARADMCLNSSNLLSSRHNE